MAKDPAYPKYAQDFLMDTLFMTDAETAAYAKVEALCWMKEDLSVDEANRVHPLCEKMALRFPEKFTIENGIIICLDHIKTKNFRAKNKENGNKGGRPKNQDTNLNKNPKHNPNNNQDTNLSNEIEIEEEIKIEVGKEGVGEKQIELDVTEVLTYFSEVTKKKIDIANVTNRNFVKGRLNDKIAVELLKKIIDLKYSQWKDDIKMKAFIRIETLFNKTKCNSYLTEVNNPDEITTPIAAEGKGTIYTEHTTNWDGDN